MLETAPPIGRTKKTDVVFAGDNRGRSVERGYGENAAAKVARTGSAVEARSRYRVRGRGS